MKLYKDYTKEFFSFLVNDTTIHQIIHLHLGRTYYKMTVNEKIKTIEQKKAQHVLDRQTAKIFALSSGNIGKTEFLTGNDALREKGLLKKVAEAK